jgi:hypothetical protein
VSEVADPCHQSAVPGACNFRERRWNAGCSLRVLCYRDGTLGDLSALVPGLDAPVGFSGIRPSDTTVELVKCSTGRLPFGARNAPCNPFVTRTLGRRTNGNRVGNSARRFEFSELKPTAGPKRARVGPNMGLVPPTSRQTHGAGEIF